MLGYTVLNRRTHFQYGKNIGDLYIQLKNNYISQSKQSNILEPQKIFVNQPSLVKLIYEEAGAECNKRELCL
jgi:hypothetical protein